MLLFSRLFLVSVFLLKEKFQNYTGAKIKKGYKSVTWKLKEGRVIEM